MYRAIGKNFIRFKNHQICEFGKIWRFSEGEHCKIGSFSCENKLFKIPFLTTFVLIKTLYLPDFSLFQKNYECIFEFKKKIIDISSFYVIFGKIYLIFHSSRSNMKIYLNSIVKELLFGIKIYPFQ